jgi:NitT/TauT family transport system substrate-binding protein
LAATELGPSELPTTIRRHLRLNAETDVSSLRPTQALGNPLTDKGVDTYSVDTCVARVTCPGRHRRPIDPADNSSQEEVQEMRKIVGITAAMVASAAALAGCGGDSGSTTANGLTQIKVGYPSDTASYGDLYVCQEEGIFEKHGLDVELTLLDTSSQLLAALSSGAVQIAGGDGAAIAAGAVKGADVKAVELKLPVYFTEMWGESDIQSVEDLPGKKVGVTAPGSVTDSATRVMLEDKGLSDSVDLVNLQDLPALLAAGQNDAVDALVTAPPQGATTQEQGWHKITDMTSYESAASVYSVSGEYADENGDVVSDFVAADVECLNFLKDPANRDASVEAIMKYTNTAPEDRDLAEYGYDFFVKYWSDKPVVDEGLWQQAIEDAAEGGEAPDPADSIDNSFVDDAIANMESDGGSKASGKR